MASKTKFGWYIEEGRTDAPCYFTGRLGPCDKPEFTMDIYRAKAYPTKAAAEAYAREFGLTLKQRGCANMDWISLVAGRCLADW